MRALLLALGLFACAAEEPKPVPPAPEYVGTWRSRDETVRLVLTDDGKIQYTRGKWTNTGIVVGWNAEGFQVSAYPKPEQHKVTVTPHEQDGYPWMTVDDTEVYRQSTEAKIGAPVPPKPAEKPAEPAPAAPAAP